jgi:hypothetical protein
VLALGLAALLFAAPGSAHDAGTGCWPRGSRTLVENREARIYIRRGYDDLFGHGWQACSFRYRRRVNLTVRDGEDPEARAPLVANRRWVVFGVVDCIGAAGCSYDLTERSLRSGRQRFDETNGGDETCPDGGLDENCGLDAAGRVLLRRDGSVAWIACWGDTEGATSECTEHPYYLLVRDHRGVRELDKGRIRIRSLDFTHHKRRIAWRSHGKRHSARLY